MVEPEGGGEAVQLEEDHNKLVDGAAGGVEEGEMEEDSDVEKSLRPPNGLFLTELNLVLIVAFLSLSGEERLSLEDMEAEEDSVKADHKAKETVPNPVQRRKQVVCERKIFDCRTPRFQTKIRDCRHSRRM